MTHKLRIDRRRVTPLHAQIEQLLRGLVCSPAYRNGRLLPTEVVLARRLKVSRNTVRAAMARLESEGLLERTPKVGTRAVPGRPHISLEHWHSFTREMQRQGICVENFELALKREPAGAEAAAALGVEPRTAVWLLRRVRGWDGVPVVLALSWLHSRLGVKGTEDFQQPLYEVILRSGGIAPAMSREEFRAIAADRNLSRALRIETGQPVLLRKRVILDSARRPIEYNLNYYRTDRYTLTLDLAGPAS
jgi:GntR family transcriptional regulator